MQEGNRKGFFFLEKVAETGDAASAAASVRPLLCPLVSPPVSEIEAPCSILIENVVT